MGLGQLPYICTCAWAEWEIRAATGQTKCLRLVYMHIYLCIVSTNGLSPCLSGEDKAIGTISVCLSAVFSVWVDLCGQTRLGVCKYMHTYVLHMYECAGCREHGGMELQKYHPYWATRFSSSSPKWILQCSWLNHSLKQVTFETIILCWMGCYVLNILALVQVKVRDQWMKRHLNLCIPPWICYCAC